MINILKERLLDGMEIKKVKEWKSKYDVTFSVHGQEIKAELTRYCGIGYENSVVDSVMFNVMVKSALLRGDIEEAKMWLDKDLRRCDEAIGE